MGGARAKTINLLLYEGDLGGVISIEDSSWNSGELYSAPRGSVSDLIETGACSKYGVYLLLSHDMVYVGQSSDLAKRITQHTMGKDWWESVVILTTKDDSLNHSDIDYLESVLIEKAQKINKLDCDNKTKGNPVKVDKFRRVYLGQYLEEALFLMQLIGITVFSEHKVTTKAKKSSDSLINTLETSTVLTVGRRAKAEAIAFLKEKGVDIGKKVSYANKMAKKDVFWLNPQVSFLDDTWDLILNDNVNSELIVIRVPAKTFHERTGQNGHLVTRKDKPSLIDLNINSTSFVDTRGYADFSPYIIKRIKY